VQVVRIYTGDDGESHIEDLDLGYRQVARDYLETAPQRGGGVRFYSIPAGHFSDWHTAPCRQYVITLEGEVEIGLGDGSTRVFRAGDVELVEDVTGRGHTARVLGSRPRVMIAVELQD
jgi:quercetin dioxygenase-like cupin family protein